MSAPSLALMVEAECAACPHSAHWHLKGRGQAGARIKRGRCIAHVKNERGFPAKCGCHSYRVKP